MSTFRTVYATIQTVAGGPHGPDRAAASPQLWAVGLDLTRREREIITLLCQRLTDPEIAERLCISPRTASTHVGNIFGKLGVSNRREAAALAAHYGLV
jgi:DNA-binding CsgD family transcriptional regulator